MILTYIYALGEPIPLISQDYMKKFAVFGNPVNHSLSPYIHQQFARQTGIALSYDAIAVETSVFKERVREFFANGGSGLNITIPHKHNAWQLATIKAANAQAAEAANTLYVQDGELTAANTDGEGLVQDIRHNLHWQLKGERILVLGAGGAASAIIPALAATQPAAILIANRTPAKAAHLARQFSQFNLTWCELDRLPDYTILINATSISLSDKVELPKNMLHPELHCYDMVYPRQDEEDTSFNQWAHQYGVQATANGIGMLVEQAALSYNIWHGVTPDTRLLLKLLRKN